MGRKEGRVKPKAKPKSKAKPPKSENAELLGLLKAAKKLGLKARVQQVAAFGGADFDMRLSAASIVAGCFRYGPGFVVGVVSDTMRQMANLEPEVGHEDCKRNYAKLHELFSQTEKAVKDIFADIHKLNVN